MSRQTVQIYGDSFFIEDGSVTVNGADTADVVANLVTEEVLEAIEFDIIVEYVARIKAEEADE